MATSKIADFVKANLPPYELVGVGKRRKRAEVTPHTNRGVNSPTISLDYLTVTFRKMRQVERIQSFMYGMFFEASLNCRETIRLLKIEGRNNYSAGYAAHLGGKELGCICWGGNRGTVMVEIKGALCRFINEKLWRRLHRFVSRYHGRITRADLAADFFQGELCVRCANDVYKACGADFLGLRRGGRLPKAQFIDGGLNGSTLTIGSRTGGRQICIYEKGRQLSFFDEPWTRAEVRYKHHRSGPKVYMVPADMINPDMWWSYWAESAEYLRKLSAAAKQVQIGAVDIGYDTFLDYLRQQSEHCRRQYGGLIGFLASVLGPILTCRYLGHNKWAGLDLYPGWEKYSDSDVNVAVKGVGTF